MHVFIDQNAVGWRLWVMALCVIFIFFTFSHFFGKFYSGHVLLLKLEKALKVFLFLIPLTHFFVVKLGWHVLPWFHAF